MRNEIKLKFEEPDYIVDEKNGVVICKLFFYILYPPCVEATCCPLYRGFAVKGVARVGENDTFDVNIGKKVALARAEQKAYKKVQKSLDQKVVELLPVLNKIGDFRHKAFKVVAHNEEYINKF